MDARHGLAAILRDAPQRCGAPQDEVVNVSQAPSRAMTRKVMPLFSDGSFAKPTAPSNPRGAAVGAGVVAAFQPAARMEDDGARMAHRVGVALGEHLDIMSGAQQAVDHVAVEAILHAQAGDGRAPGAAIEPERPPERVCERRAVEHMAGEYRSLRLRLAVA